MKMTLFIIAVIAYAIALSYRHHVSSNKAQVAASKPAEYTVHVTFTSN